MQKLSAVISAYNEEEKIEKCLKALSFADEIIFVDNSSEDRTVEIAKKYTKNIFTQKNDPLSIDLQKNFGFKKANCEWVLSIDADEIVSEDLAREIKNLLMGENLKEGYYIPRKNIIFGKEINFTGWYPDHQMRLFRKDKGEYKKEHVHESIKIDGETGYLNENLLHYNYESISQFIHKNMIIYAQNEANNLINDNFKLTPDKLISYPAKEFLSRFFSRKGYRDGIHGLFLSLLMAASHLVTLSYVWEKQGFFKNDSKSILIDVEKEFYKFGKDMKYWISFIKSEESKNLATKYFHKFKSKI